MRVSAIIPAAGSGQRFGEAKQYKKLAGRSILFHAMAPFVRCKQINEIIIVVPENDIEYVKQKVLLISASKSIQVVAGGALRQDSVKNGIDVLSQDSELVCIHDAVRPFVTEELIERSIFQCSKYDGSVLGVQVMDTIKIVQKKLITSTINRDTVWLAQTPQTFHKKKLVNALENAEKQCLVGTDESSLMELIGCKITIVPGHINNFKITTKDDFRRAELTLDLIQEDLKGDNNAV